MQRPHHRPGGALAQDCLQQVYQQGQNQPVLILHSSCPTPCAKTCIADTPATPAAAAKGAHNVKHCEANRGMNCRLLQKCRNNHCCTLPITWPLHVYHCAVASSQWNSTLSQAVHRVKSAGSKHLCMSNNRHCVMALCAWLLGLLLLLHGPSSSSWNAGCSRCTSLSSSSSWTSSSIG